jgi:hypothetical protein
MENLTQEYVEQLQSELREERLKNEALHLSLNGIGERKLRLIDVETALALINREAVEFDEANKPQNLGALLEELTTAKPFLLEQQTTGVTTSAANPPRGSILTLEAIKQMTPAEINARWAEVEAILKEG